MTDPPARTQYWTKATVSGAIGEAARNSTKRPGVTVVVASHQRALYLRGFENYFRGFENYFILS